jgi:flagellar protein FlaJ
MGLKRIHWFGIIAAVLILLLDLLFFRNNERMLFFLMGIGAGLAALPFIVDLVLENKREQQISESFLEFSRSLAESVAAGTPISKSIINMKKKNYSSLTPYVQKLSNQIELGIPVDQALLTFGEDTGSIVIKRAVALIREAEKAGGEIEYILDSTAKSISEVENLKKERKAAISNLVVQGYIIFFIFIGIILVMEYKILPLTSGLGSFGGLSFNVQSFTEAPKETAEPIPAEDFAQPFLFLLMTQGFFAGLVIGKLTEGAIKKGLKHSFILMTASFLISYGTNILIPLPGTA